MSEVKKSEQTKVKLNGLLAFKVGMATVFNDKGEALPVTILKTGNWIVTQIKTKEKDGYTAVQLSTGSRKLKNANASEVGHSKKSGLSTSSKFTTEIRQELPENLELGQELDIDSLTAGDVVKVTSKSKGRGFAGAVKRYGFAGGPASHGSGFHRAPGSAGCRTWPGRVLPGKRYPGHYGHANVTVKGLEVVNVIPEEQVVFVKGAIPGAANTLVTIMKVQK